MPELPEVEVVRRGLEQFVVGRRIKTVEVLHPRAVRRHEAGPADFAARVIAQLPAAAAQLPTPAVATLNPGRFGSLAGVACMVVLLVLMLVFAPWSTGGSLYWFSIQLVFCAQFALLAVWLVARGSTSANSL